MKKYLLLRDNKQSGPYSIEEIRAIGLKAYDLIWVEGRSAAWRYPGEVDEFKSFAPQVEEQPFDRFYKRPAGEAKTALYSSVIPVADEKPRIVAEIKPQIIGAASAGLSSETEQKSKVIPLSQTDESQQQVNAAPVSQKSRDKEGKRQKYVSVSMPSGTIKSANPAPIDQREEKRGQKFHGESKWNQPPVGPVETNTKSDAALKQELPGSTPVVQMIPAKKQVVGNILQVFAITVAVFSLVAVGVLIGIGIGSKQLKEPAPVAQKTATETTVPTDNSTPVDEDPPPVTTVQQETVAKPIATDQKEKTRKAAVKPVTIVPVATEVKPTASEPIATTPAETSKVADPKEIARQNISQLVSATTNDYKVGMFGGIDDVKVTVFNTSDYPVDLVVVDVSYIQNNKKSFKKESLHFNDIAANSSLTLNAPKSAKGIKIKTTITHIASKTLGVSENLW